MGLHDLILRSPFPRQNITFLVILVAAFLSGFETLFGSEQSPDKDQDRMAFQNRLGFKQEFNTYVWQAHFSKLFLLSNRWNLAVTERFRSSLLKLATQSDKWKEDQYLQMSVGYRLSPVLHAQTQATSIVFLDKLTGLYNDVRTHALATGLTYTPRHNISGGLMAGPKWDSRLSRSDRGWSFLANTQVSQVNWQDYENSLNVSFGQDRLATRRNQNWNLNYGLFREFAAMTFDSLTILNSSYRRDNYLSAAGDVESLRESYKGVENVIRYQLSAPLALRWKTGLGYRNVAVWSFSGGQEQKKRRRNDQRYSNELVLYYQRPQLTSHAVLSFWSQQQKYDIDLGKIDLPFSGRTAFITPDNEINRLSLLTSLGWRIADSDSLGAFFSVSRFRYDTPDTNNFDDRDELRINTRLVERHRFREWLWLELEASVNLYHMVYVFGERSADNNWNRIFRLRPSVIFTPHKRLRWSQSFEVLANYVEYDFESLSGLPRSFVFRKFAMDDSVRLELFNRTVLLLDYRLQLEENGQLFWERWSERVLATRRNQWFHIFWRYEMKKPFYFSPGYSYYLREEWRHRRSSGGLEIRERFAVFSSQGPAMRIYYAPSTKTRLLLEAIRYAVDPPDQKKYFINNIEMELSWIF